MATSEGPGRRRARRGRRAFASSLGYATAPGELRLPGQANPGARPSPRPEAPATAPPWLPSSWACPCRTSRTGARPRDPHRPAAGAGSAAIHASWNLWIKQLGPGVQRAAPVAAHGLSAVVYAPFAWGVFTATGWRPDARALVLVLGSGFIHVGYFVAAARLPRRRLGRSSTPSRAAPARCWPRRGRCCCWGAAHRASVTGTLLIASGVLVIAGRPAGLTPRKLGPGVFYGLATGVSIAAYTLWDGWSVKRAPHPAARVLLGGRGDARRCCSRRSRWARVARSATCSVRSAGACWGSPC